MVDGYHEALILRNEGIRTPLLVMGFTPSENVLSSRLHNVAFMVGDLEQLKTLATHRQSQCRLHLKVDTGLHRHGVAPSEFNEALRLITSAPGLELEGICSHFADASGSDTAFTKTQLTGWNRLVEPHLDLCAVFTYRQYRRNHLDAGGCWECSKGGARLVRI